MGKFFSIIFFVESFNSEINQKYITENIVNKICEILGCDYDKLGYILLHPDYNNKDIGYLYKKKNKEKFYSRDIPSIMYGIKYKDEKSSPCLLYETNRSNWMSYSDFEVRINYPLVESNYLRFEIVIKKSLLKNKNIKLEEYIKILDLLNENNFKVNTSFTHYYSGSNSRSIIKGFDSFFSTIEEKYIINRALEHNFDWKNKIVDVFLYNTFRRDCLNDIQLSKLEKIVGKENIIYDNEYLIFKYCNCESEYLIEKYIPSIKKIRLRMFFKKNNMM